MKDDYNIKNTIEKWSIISDPNNPFVLKILAEKRIKYELPPILGNDLESNRPQKYYLKKQLKKIKKGMKKEEIRKLIDNTLRSIKKLEIQESISYDVFGNDFSSLSMPDQEEVLEIIEEKMRKYKKE